MCICASEQILQKRANPGTFMNIVQASRCSQSEQIRVLLCTLCKRADALKASKSGCFYVHLCKRADPVKASKSGYLYGCSEEGAVCSPLQSTDSTPAPHLHYNAVHCSTLQCTAVCKRAHPVKASKSGYLHVHCASEHIL